MRGHPQSLPSMINNGRLEFLLVVLLAILSAAMWTPGSGWGVAVDLAACLGAALAIRWPTIGGWLLGAVLVGYVCVPAEAAEIGQFAPLIPILGSGMRGERRIRAFMSAGYGTVQVVLMAVDARSLAEALIAALLWSALIAVFWLIGDAFVAYREAHEQLQRSAVLEERVAVARDLHDTVARTLARTAVRAQRAFDASDPAQLETVLAGVQQASVELRSMMSLLRDGSERMGFGPQLSGSVTHDLDTAVALLKKSGFPAAVTVEGDPQAVSPAVAAMFGAVLGELISNIERHAPPGHRCALILGIDDDALNLAAINDLAPDAPAKSAAPSSMGLLGLRERLIQLGGDLDTRQEGTRWVTQVTIPVA